ncbi:hypothetical protein Tco_0862508 [Tanacetum coccineum]
MKREKVKVSWDDVCLPKYKGGLGVRKLESFNVALMSTHIWKLITHKESMWVKWIHAYKLKHRSFWDLGNGGKASVWYDTWDELCPFINHVTYRAVSNAGYNRLEKVADVVNEDTLMWKYEGVLYEFSVKHAWHAVRGRGVEVDWSHLDGMRQWHVGNGVDLSLLHCPLRKAQPDSHEHLFFECPFSTQVRNNVMEDVRQAISAFVKPCHLLKCVLELDIVLIQECLDMGDAEKIY